MNETGVIANRYEIQEFIAHGGMGDVYKGIDRPTGQIVAIKILKPELVASDPAQVQRFVREGELLAKLNHPNIVKVLASVEEQRRNFIVMEYVGGGTLRDLLNQQPVLPLDRALDIALDLADALTRAHRLNVLHRDIKPANVLLAEDGTPRLSDFGVAKLPDSELTQTGAVIGTYAYLSPEACKSQQIDARTDIWSFGVMLFEMVAGQRPFEAEPGAGPTTILLAIMQDPVPDLTQLRKDLPRPLVSLINRMLEKDINKRVGSIRQVGTELEAIIATLSHKAGNDTSFSTVIAPDSSRFAAMTPTPPPIKLSDGDDDLDFRVEFVQTGANSTTPPRRKINRVLVVAAIFAGFLLGIILSIAVFRFFSPDRGRDNNNNALIAFRQQTATHLAETASAIETANINGTAQAIALAITDTPSPTITANSTDTPESSPTQQPSNTPTRTSEPSSTASATSTTTIPASPTATSSNTSTSAPVVPTVLHPAGEPLILMYSEQAFYIVNPAEERVRYNLISFESIAPGRRQFAGSAWATEAGYNFIDPHNCVLLANEGRPQDPPECNQRNAVAFTIPSTQFWMEQRGAQEFRVLWNGDEIARCPILSDTVNLATCEVFLPPQP